MTNIKKMLIGLDLTEMDDLLVQYTSYLCDVLQEVDEVVFVHNIRLSEQEDMNEILSMLDKPLEEVVAEGIHETIDSHFRPAKTNVKTHVSVERMSSTPSFLAAKAKEHSVDLIAVGKKLSYRGSGLVVEKLLRIISTSTSVMLVPETAYHRFQEVLVPIDFSRHAKKAVAAGHYFRVHHDAKLTCQHVFNVPSFYFPAMAESGMEKRLHQAAEKKWNKFEKELKSEGIDQLECALSFNPEKSIAETIYDHAVRTHKDLIVMASKGKGGIASFAVGSIAMQMVKYDLHIPLLIVKAGDR
ncbi:MAG: universal stress protein [Saprospiraceae bacterium]|nr:universal stress protein [Saprospiraceae bacterium]